MRIIVYTQPACQPCRAVVRRLTQLGATFETVDVRETEGALDYVQRLGYRTTPVVVLAHRSGRLAEHFGGFNPQRLNGFVALQQRGPA